MEGWICLHRSILDHWIHNDPVRFRWWIDMLLLVNHKQEKVLIGNTIIQSGRGQAVMSLASWARLWRVSKDTVRDFFNVLERDGMITRENLIVTTRITVCNYDRYQTDSHAEQTDSIPHSKRVVYTNNNDNNDDKVTESDTRPSLTQKAKNEELVSKLEDGLEYKNFLIKVSEQCPYCFSHMNMPTCNQYGKLAEKYSKSEIMEMSERIENRTDLRKKYRNLGSTLNTWLKREYPERSK